MNEFTVTSEIKKMDKFDEELVIKNMQKVLIKLVNEKGDEINDRSNNNVNSMYS